MTEEVWNELHRCMDMYSVSPTPSNRYDIDHDYTLRFDVDPYSPTYEPLIKQAVQYRREGNYDEAIRCHIKIFYDAKCFNAEIVRFLCQALICDGELILAFKLLSAAYCELKNKCGPCPNPYEPSIPWAQYDDGLKLARACYDFAKTKNLYPFCAYVATIAGDPAYRPQVPETTLLTQAYKIVRAMKSNRSKK